MRQLGQYRKRRLFKNTKVKVRARYYWVCAMAYGEEGNTIQVMTLDHNKPKEKSNFKPLYLTFYSLSKGYAGWDLDRQRFFVHNKEQKHQNTNSKESRFLRDNWERNNGFAPSKVPCRYIDGFLNNKPL